MKTIFYPFCLLILLFAANPGYAQKYKSASDTIKLNKAYIKLQADIADLDAKLIKSKNELPSYEEKVREANKDAADAASASSDQASKANNGKIKDAKKAKKKANKAYGEARDSQAADGKLKDLQRKISHYEEDLTRKQQQLQELDQMRAAINAKILTGNVEPRR
ncbi:MAG: hypothetical protein H7Y86_01960 [Rhizobacter sp.]|nr:hypothetical protein [Ferruginibacter sp.]